MTFRPPHTHARIWRWLVTGAALLVLVAAYWITLDRIGFPAGDDGSQTLRPTPGLDRHTPRVD